MVLELYSPAKDDMPEIVELGYDGYADSIITPLVYPVPVSEQQIADNTKAALDNYGKDPHHTNMAVKDTETGKIVSWMEWLLVPKAKDDDWNVYKPRPAPPGWHKDFVERMFKLAWQSKIDAMGRQPYICKSLPFPFFCTMWLTSQMSKPS